MTSKRLSDTQIETLAKAAADPACSALSVPTGILGRLVAEVRASRSPSPGGGAREPDERVKKGFRLGVEATAKFVTEACDGPISVRAGLADEIRALASPPSPAEAPSRVCRCGHPVTSTDPVCPEWGPGYDEATGVDCGGCACTDHTPADPATKEGADE